MTLPHAAILPLSLVGSADEPLLAELLRRLSPPLCGRELSGGDSHYAAYLARLRTCVAYHAARFAQERPLPPAQVVRRLERGELGSTPLKGNVLREVVLAQALELREQRAAEVFESEFMPTVCAIARSMGGERGAKAVENFAAELVLPRVGRSPKIATYLGRTTLAQWLAPVVANALRTEQRRRQPEVLANLPEPSAGAADLTCALDSRQCEELLRPIFAGSCRAIAASDRLLLQMLVLDGVPQQEVARSLGLHSGTITRRRQHAAAALLSRARCMAAECPRPRQADDCFQLILAGDDPELGRRLADVLAQGVRQACED